MKRYDIRFSLSEGEHAGETEDGEWVKYEDVKPLLEKAMKSLYYYASGSKGEEVADELAEEIRVGLDKELDL